MAASNRILVKLMPSARHAVAETRANLRPLHDVPQGPAALGIAPAPEWYVADLPDAAETPWDCAHARVAEQLGVAATDVLFAEPDMANEIYRDDVERKEGIAAVGEDCESEGQTSKGRRVMGPDVFAWHLGDDYSQLDAARRAVVFSQPRTRIAHIDTGFYPPHLSMPEHVRRDLERNFVKSDGTPNDAEDPNNDAFLIDNSGHGTGTISILAGGKAADHGDVHVGGAPEAEVVPLRIADRVTLFYTSTFAKALKYAVRKGCDVVSISMGGLPSAAWNDAVNEAYEAGVCIVAAAGNNLEGLPTRHIVYPARYGRVIAACGVMADNNPYSGLQRVLEGNYGPQSRMASALAAYTPNIPWAKFECRTAIRRNGEGTSAATPQIAAAAALWYEKYKANLHRDWRRVEAVRKALFDSAKHKTVDPKRLGNGILQAADALAIPPFSNLPKTDADSDWLAFLRVLTGLGITEIPARERMFNLELMQRWLLNEELQAIVDDPDSGATLKAAQQRKFMEAAIEDTQLSGALRRHLIGRYPALADAKAFVPRKQTAAPAAAEPAVALLDPPYRRVRVYAVDPSFSTRLETAAINEVVLKVKWEDLAPGPVGEYLDFTDPHGAGKDGALLDLNDPRLLAQDGWAPSEGNRAFRHQMVYAVAMKTIAHFELALGRPVLWRAAIKPGKPFDDSTFVRRLRVSPQALRQANAFYSPEAVALQFGYFEAATAGGGNVPGSLVYAALSHDIIAHETSHAILDGMHRRFNEPSNVDVLALHEGFADIVALMQHFTIPELLANEIGRTRGDLEAESMLGSLAVQFGHGAGGRGALRDAIGRYENGKWTRLEPDPSELDKRVAPHARGAILVAAVFDAFIAMYRSRTADLLRIYTRGTGVLPSGAIHPDLVGRLAAEAVTSARHVLNMCIRALDYIPPVDITFGEYLRGIITADVDLVGDDRYNYRVAFVEAFRAHGIYPRDLETLSVDTLRWQGIDLSNLTKKEQAAIEREYATILIGLRKYAEACVYMRDRQELFEETRRHRIRLAAALKKAFKATPKFAEELGLDPQGGVEVHALRRSLRIAPDGGDIPQVLVSLTQSKVLDVDGRPGMFRGGSTLIIDLSKPVVKYRIFKRIGSETRRERTLQFLREAYGDPLRALLVAPDREPFALLHLLGDTGDV